MALKLYTYPNNYRAIKSLIAAQYAGVDIRPADEFKFPGDVRSEEFAQKNPVKKVPVLETADGCLFESNAILRHVGRSGPAANLMGSTHFEQAQVDQWIDFSASELEPPRNTWIYPIIGIMKADKRSAGKAKHHVEECLKVLDNHLLLRTYLVGERVTLADIAVGAALIALYEKVFEESLRSKYCNVTRWFTTLINQPQWKKVLGDVKLCVKEEVPAEPEKKQKQPKQKKQKQQQPKKEESEAPKKPEKKKNPLLLLPKSSMDLDSVKRNFSNNPFAEALKTFYEEFDAEGYCLYTSDYNYNDENTIDFQTSNLVSGWLQRLESLRKFGFGCVNIWGVEDSKGPFKIRGAWVFRGPTPPEEYTGCPDSEYHTVQRVDLANAADKKRFEELLGGSDNFDGQPLYERKYFK